MTKLRATERKQHEKTEKQMQKQMKKQMQSSMDSWKRFGAILDVGELRIVDWNCSDNGRDNSNNNKDNGRDNSSSSSSNNNNKDNGRDNISSSSSSNKNNNNNNNNKEHRLLDRNCTGNWRDNNNEEAELLLGLNCSHRRRESIKRGKRPREILTKNKNEITKSKIRERRAQLASTPPPQMPMELQNKVAEIAGTPEANPIWVDSMMLFESDVSETHCRLSLSKKVREMLTAAELAMTGALDVMVVDPMLKVWDTLKFNIWKSTMQYVLIKDWRKLVGENNFEAGDTLHIWAFRLIDQNNKLCFVLNLEKAQA